MWHDRELMAKPSRGYDQLTTQARLTNYKLDLTKCRVSNKQNGESAKINLDHFRSFIINFRFFLKRKKRMLAPVCA